MLKQLSDQSLPNTNDRYYQHHRYFTSDRVIIYLVDWSVSRLILPTDNQILQVYKMKDPIYYIISVAANITPTHTHTGVHTLSLDGILCQAIWPIWQIFIL